MLRSDLIYAGDDSAAESDASSLSDYDPASDPMDRFAVTALPMSNPHMLQQPPSSSWHESLQQSQQQLPHAREGSHGDDSAHNPGNLEGTLEPGLEEEEALAARPDLAAMRARDDSAKEMPVAQSAFLLVQCEAFCTCCSLLTALHVCVNCSSEVTAC